MTHPLDPSNFRQMILESPDQFRVGMELARDIKVPGLFEAIEISGMGGSALPGNLFRVFLSDIFAAQSDRKPLAIYQNHSYSLPPEAFHQCLNFIVSYSGNTEETIASFEEALHHNLPCVGISAGGKIEAMCREHGVPHINLPIPFENFQPRIGTGYFIGALLQVLINSDLLKDISQEVLTQAAELKTMMPTLEKQGKLIGKRLVGKTPIVYAGTKYKAVAMVWKIKLNENAKTPAFWNFFPELNHNEMLGFTNPQAKFIIVMLRDQNDHPQNLKRFTVTAELLEKQGIESVVVDIEGESVFKKMFGTLYLGDWASYYLALEYGQDPTTVAMVEELKKMLAPS